MRRAVYRMLGVAAVLTAALGLLNVGSALAASITTFTPIQGSVDANGSIVTLTGSGFTNAKNVLFNGTPGWFQVMSDTQIVARVPVGATTGYITVSAADGTTPSTAGLTITGTTNGQFQVLPSFNQPGTNANLTPATSGNASQAHPHALVKAFAPRSGAPGTKVVIKGSNFKGTASVRFGGVGAASFKVTDSAITVTVPEHAKTGKITVTTGAGTTSSVGVFTVK